MKIIPAALLLAFTLAPLTAQAQSFNCRYASRPDEVLICQSGELSQLDSRMSGLYFRLRNQLGGNARYQLEAEQKNWLAGRMSCGRDYSCIANSYHRRINQLESY